MRGRVLALVLTLYVALDFATPFAPGAFEFDPDDSVDAVSVVRDSADAGISPLAKDTAGWRDDDLLAGVRPPRSLARPPARPMGVRRACASAPCRDRLSPGDDH